MHSKAIYRPNDILAAYLSMPAGLVAGQNGMLFREIIAVLQYFESVLRSLGLDERRKARNLLIKPGIQLRLPLYVFLLSFTFVLLAVLFGNLYFEQTYVTLLQSTSQSEYVQRILDRQAQEFKLLALLLLLGYVLLMVVVTMIYTHRLLGPAIPMLRHVKALQEGRYSHRIKLRKYDAFTELADQLNELAETLQNSHRRL
jgi:HAMP domain-containing protein